MTLEEKAKAYDKALEIAKKNYETSQNLCDGSIIGVECFKNTLTSIFPELAESEDERIRKGMLQGFKDYNEPKYEWWKGVKVKECITWLEKQGESIEINPSEFDLRLNKLLKQFETLHKEELANSLSFYLNVVQNDGTYKPEKQGHDGKKWIYEDVYIKEKEQVYQDGVDDVIENPQKYGLEKQGEEKSAAKNIVETWKDMRLEVYQQASGNRHEPNYSDDSTKMFSLNDIDEIIEKIGEQKYVDKHEPKFKIGDFIVNDYCSGRVVKLTDDAYLLDTGQEMPFSCEHNIHLWSIKDARDGDVLVDKSDGVIGIFQSIGHHPDGGSYNDPSYCFLHCRYDDGDFYADFEHGNLMDSDDAIPATREQRDLLFSKMKETGYEWNVDKKELSQLEVTKKSEGWSEEDEEQLNCIIKEIESELKKPYFEGYDLICNKKISWLKSLKQRLQ